jgi:DNA-binding FrmR family transcriptional regulator
MATGGVFLAYLVSLFFTSDPEDLNRYARLGLQFCGLLLVARGIAETRQLFGKPTLLERIKAWWRALVAAIKPPKTVHPTIAMTGTAGLSASGTLVVAKVVQSLDARVEELERRVGELQGGLDALTRAVQQEAVERTAEIAREVAAVRAELAGVRGLMEDYAAGGLSLEMAAFVWLVIGTLVSSLPGELAFIARGVLAAWTGVLTLWSWIVHWNLGGGTHWG